MDVPEEVLIKKWEGLTTGVGDETAWGVQHRRPGFGGWVGPNPLSWPHRLAGGVFAGGWETFHGCVVLIGNLQNNVCIYIYIFIYIYVYCAKTGVYCAKTGLIIFTWLFDVVDVIVKLNLQSLDIPITCWGLVFSKNMPKKHQNSNLWRYEIWMSPGNLSSIPYHPPPMFNSQQARPWKMIQ